MIFRALLVLWFMMAGCCPRQEIRREGSFDRGIIIYDPNTDTYYDFYTDSWDVRKWRERRP